LFGAFFDPAGQCAQALVTMSGMKDSLQTILTMTRYLQQGSRDP
jgi:hypothetical protein